jgi:hypothetical protein
MTEEEKKLIRENTKMKLFNFYLDDVTKYEVLKKLRELGVDTKKGAIAATIRVLLNIFVESEDESFDTFVAERVELEYLLTTKKNKRSRL